MVLEVREWDQLVRVLVVATIMLALLAVGQYWADVSRHLAHTAVSAPRSERPLAPASREGLFRALVSDLR